MPRPETHLYEIEMRISRSRTHETSLDLVLPAWTPGSYLVRDFARHVRSVTAFDAKGRPLHVEKVDKARWRVTLEENSGALLVVRYTVYAHELSVRTSHLDGTHAYGNGANLFFYVEGRKDEPQALRFALPKGWKVSIALPRRGSAFRAADYDELVDSPFECGTHRTFGFRVHGVPHTLALWGRGNEDPKRLVHDLAALAREAARLFGGLPYERYLFIAHLQPGAGGGLEHRASQSVGIGPWKFRPESSYRENVLLLFAHELFHAWNVKRIRPDTLGPFDYTREVYTRDLWAMEGITSYYEALLPVRATLMTPAQGFEEWCKELKAHRDNPGSRRAERGDGVLRHVDPLLPSRRELAERGRELLPAGRARRARAGPDPPPGYTRPAVARRRAALPLPDVRGERSRLSRRCSFEKATERFLGRASKSFFDRYVRGVETPDFASLLRPFGLKLREKPEKDADGKEPVRAGRRADFGWKTKLEGGRLTVAEVHSGRAAYEAGVAPGDELVALDGVKADEEHLGRIEKEGVPGAHVDLAVFRRSRLISVPVVLGTRRAFTYEIVPREDADRRARSRYRGWVGKTFPGKSTAR